MRRTALVAFLSLASTHALAQDPAPRYSADVRPILARRCFKCHGPDERERKAGLRLDVAGHGAEDAILERITSEDPAHVMPPPRSGKSLNPAQIATLRAWLGAGARYEKHWAFVPPARVTPPELPGSAHPIDRFVRAAQRARGLEHAPRADRRTLLRRVQLDLIGLPPTPDELRAFLEDDAPGAYERVVERLLASPHYGERWARRWLDLARYADSNGYEKDRPRSIWPYRDWVIRALNADMPYDRFLVEQIAGDMLEDASDEQRVATGFHRNTMLNEEGGIDPREYRYHALVDRVATTGSAVLGLTLACAQCHTHKFDPITHREYFGLMAFLDNADEPDLELVTDAERAAHAERKAEADALELEALWPADAPPLADEFGRWLEEARRHASDWRVLVPTRAQSEQLHLVVDEESGVVDAYGDTTKHDIYNLELAPSARPIAALRLEALPSEELPARGPGTTYFEGRKGDFFLRELELRVDGEPVALARATESNRKPRPAHDKSKAPLPFRSPLAIDGDIQTGWSGSHSVGKRAVAVFELREPLPAGSALSITMHFGRHYPASIGRLRISATESLRGDATQARSAELDALLAVPDEELTDAQRAALRRAFLLGDPRMKEHAKRVRALTRAPRGTLTLVMRERPEWRRRTTRLRHRGEYLSPREAVAPHTPAALHAFPSELPADRLGFARWLASPENPLTARVAVNRHWAALFGRGIVKSLGDFGAQGEMPSHPELLDWLARAFVDEGWSVKALHRLLVTSETYKQDARVRDARDPENRWLARGPRFRLEGEILRDSLLRAAGLLEPRLFGPPVRPPQPAGVTEVAYGKPRWNASRGPDRYRRSIYTFAKRTAPFAFFETFDAPSGESCVAMRDRSNTPLQALTLLNDPMTQEIARAFGTRIEREAPGSDDAARIRYAYRVLLTRGPSDAELRAVEQYLADERVRGTRDVWAALARVLFALDETMRRG